LQGIAAAAKLVGDPVDSTWFGFRVLLRLEVCSAAGKTHLHEQVENQKENAI